MFLRTTPTPTRTDRLPSNPRSRAFTLIELLVCLAVIALLLSILLPALASARAAGQASVCASNIRQLTLGLDLYATDHADRYLPAAADFLSNLHRWHGTRPSTGAAFAPHDAPITPYLQPDADGVGVRACPTFLPTLRALREAGAGFERGCGGYAYNAAFVGSDRSEERLLPPHPSAHPATSPRGVSSLRSDRVGSSRARFQSPAHTIAFADAAFADQSPAGDLIEYSFLEPRFHPHLPDPVRTDPSIHFRHPSRPAGARSGATTGRATLAWLDGHVSSADLGHSWSSGLYLPIARDLAIGWPGTLDDNALFDYR